jgi:hypothetical protein
LKIGAEVGFLGKKAHARTEGQAVGAAVFRDRDRHLFEPVKQKFCFVFSSESDKRTACRQKQTFVDDRLALMTIDPLNGKV